MRSQTSTMPRIRKITCIINKFLMVNDQNTDDHNDQHICDLDDKSLMTKNMMKVKKAMTVMMITKQTDFWTTKALLF